MKPKDFTLLFDNSKLNKNILCIDKSDKKIDEIHLNSNIYYKKLTIKYVESVIKCSYLVLKKEVKK